MRTSHKLIVGIAILLTLINICILAYPIIKQTIKPISYKQGTSEEQKEALMRRIVELEQPLAPGRMKELSELRGKMVEIDSISLPDLFSYGTSLIELAYNEKDSSALTLINDKIMHVAASIKRVGPHDSDALLYAAMLFRYNGSNVLSSYDSTEVTYNKMLSLIESDSMEIPVDVEHDRKTWLKELRDHVNDLKVLNSILKRASQRKYSFIS